MKIARRYRTSLVLLVFASLVVLPGLTTGIASSVSAATYRQGYLGQGTEELSLYYVYDSRRPGPTVLVVGGVHGNEFSGAMAAEQIRSWPVQRGKLVILPCANPNGFHEKTRFIPGETKKQRDLNRNFPKRLDKQGQPRGELANRIWRFVKKTKPDWLIDLHEGTKTRASDPKGCGNTVIAHSRGEAFKMADLICKSLNKRYPDAKSPFIPLKGNGDTYLASAAASHLGAQTLIVETHRTKPPLSYRVRQHRLAVYEALKQLGMVGSQDEKLKSDPKPFAQVIRRKEKARKTVVGLYDAQGSSGRGVPSITKMLRSRSDVALVPVGPLDIQDGMLQNLDVIIFPGGSGSKQGKAIGEEGREAVRQFVKRGGGYVGICAGGYLATNRFSWALKILDAKTVSSKWKRGAGVMDVEFTPLGRKLLKPAEKTLKISYHNGPIIEPDGDDSLPNYKVLGLFRTEVAENGSPKDAMVNSPAIVSARYGAGRVVCLSPHAEGSKNEAIVERAILWVAPTRPRHRPRAPLLLSP